MTVVIRELAPSSREDAQELLALMARCTPKDAHLRIHRDPDPFALGRFFGPTVTSGAFVDGQLVGSAAVSVQRRWLDGGYRDVPYLHDLRVDPACRRMGIGSAFGAFAEAQRGTHGAIGTVIADNPLAAVIPKKTADFAGGEVPIGVTAHVVLPATKGAHSAVEVDDATWLEARRPPPSDYAPAPEYWERAGGRRLLVEHRGQRTTALLTDEGTRRTFSMGGARLSLGYLAFIYPPEPSPAALQALLTAASSDYDRVAFGLAADLARARGLPAALTSTTYAFGRPTAFDARLASHELLLI